MWLSKKVAAKSILISIYYRNSETFNQRAIYRIMKKEGINNSLGVRPDTIEMLKKSGVAVHVLQTEAEVRIYNELQKSEAVGGLFHTTC